MTDTIGVSGKVIALLETCSAKIIGIVDGDRVTTVFAHNRKTGHVGWTVPDVNHVWKRNRADFVRHVVIDVLGHVEQTLINPKQVLGLLGVADDAFWKGDSTFRILRVFAAEDFPQIGTELATFDEDLKSGGNDEVVNVNTCGSMVFFEEVPIELLEHFRKALIELHFASELFELLIARPVHGEVVEQTFHVSEFVIVPFGQDQICAAFPKFFRANPESGENDIVLHVGGAERLIVVVNDRNRVL